MDITGLLNSFLYSPDAWQIYETEPEIQNETSLLFRRQFIISPFPISVNREWFSLQLSANQYITAHPDLPVTKAQSGEKTLLIIGYALDPHHPERSDYDIAEDLVGRSADVESLASASYSLSGRFVLLYTSPQNSFILPDPGALRQVFYTRSSDGSIWIASSASLLSTVLNCPISPDIVKDLEKTALFKTSDPWLPGSLSLFSDIRHLLPNFTLNLQTGETERFWPANRLNPLSLDEHRDRSAVILKGIFDAATRRFPLAMGLSSGLDSRMLLAASRDFSDQMLYFTMISEQATSSHHDAAAASELFENLKLNHKVILLPREVPDWYSRILEKSMHRYRPVKALNSYALFRHLSLHENNTVVVWGNLAEITKRDRSRWPDINEVLLTPDYVSLMAFMHGSRKAHKEFKDWLKSARNCAKHNVRALDLLHWEHRVGSWAAGSLSEYDTAFDSLCPYNCREYIELFLRVPFKYRTKPHYKAHTDLIKKMWAATLYLPLGKQKRGFSGIALDLMYKSGVYDYLKYGYIQTVRRVKT